MGATSLLTRSVHEYGPERTTCKSMAMHKRLRPPMVRDVSRAKALVYAFVATLVIIGCCSMPVFAFNVGMHPRVDSFQICVPSFHDAHPCWGKRCPRHSRLSPAFAAPRPAESSVGESGDGSIPESHTWHWRNGWEIHYEHAKRDGAPPLLFLPGFGVGTFHFKRNIQELSKTHDVYALDFLGQGKSWPTRAPSREDGLCYSVDMWTEQVAAFIEQVIGEATYVAGNSLGGYIATNLAANHPRAVLGLALLNATPFWAFRKAADKRGDTLGSHAEDAPATSIEDITDINLPITSVPAAPGVVSIGATPENEIATRDGRDWFGWDGTLPAPAGLFRFGAWYFDRMRDPRTVKTMLGAVYSNPEAIGDDVISEIIAATERGPSNHDFGVGGHEAFTSIVFAPKASMPFEEMIDRIEVPVALIYGKEDPWVVPLWGHRIKRQRPDTLYYQVSPSGHSPHHETPETVNRLLSRWLNYAQSGGSPPLSEEGDVLQATEEGGVVARATLVADAQPRGLVEWLDGAVWRVSGGGVATANLP